MRFFPLRASKMVLIFNTTCRGHGDRNVDVKTKILIHDIFIQTNKNTYIHTTFNPTQRFVMLHGGGLFPGTLLTGNIHQKSFPPLLISRWQRERNSSNPPCAVRITVNL